ncbi:MAG: hypothetical protein NUV53_01170 [Patescibacteria group bacterium]|nr:hypothetical protein [Patescibacteria group bacterium]
MKNQTQTFHLSQVLDVLAQRLISHTSKIDGLVEILEFMTGDKILDFNHFRMLKDACEDALLQKFPVLGSPEMEAAWKKLEEAIRAQKIEPTDEGCSMLRKINNDWLAKIGDGTFGVRLVLCDPPSEEEVRTRWDLSFILGRLPDSPHKFPPPICDYFLEVAQLSAGEHTHVNPIQQLIAMTPPEKLVHVILP